MQIIKTFKDTTKKDLTLVGGKAANLGEILNAGLPVLDGFSVTAELAETDEERALGLMFRQEINPDQGMLFIFKEEGIYPFWMKNMKFSIDILWLDRGKRIIHIEENIPPCPEEPCPTYSHQLPAAYVLELKAGSVAKNQLKLLDKLEFILPSQ